MLLAITATMLLIVANALIYFPIMLFINDFYQHFWLCVFSFAFIFAQALFPLWFFRGMEQMRQNAIISIISRVLCWFYTHIVDIVVKFKDYNCVVDGYDIWIFPEEVQHEYGITPRSGSYDAIILVVAHRQFKEMGAAAICALDQLGAVLYDLKHVLDPQESNLWL